MTTIGVSLLFIGIVVWFTGGNFIDAYRERTEVMKKGNKP